MPNEFQRFVISQVAILIRDGKCLILEDAAHPGKWLLPGGRMDEGELSEPALKREIKEEISLENFENLGLVAYDIWYPGGYKDNAGVCVLVFEIINNTDKIKISSEHLSYKWITEDQIDEIDFVWSKANEMVIFGFERYKLINKK